MLENQKKENFGNLQPKRHVTKSRPCGACSLTLADGDFVTVHRLQRRGQIHHAHTRWPGTGPWTRVPSPSADSDVTRLPEFKRAAFIAGLPGPYAGYRAVHADHENSGSGGPPRQRRGWAGRDEGGEERYQEMLRKTGPWVWRTVYRRWDASGGQRQALTLLDGVAAEARLRCWMSTPADLDPKAAEKVLELSTGSWREPSDDDDGDAQHEDAIATARLIMMYDAGSWLTFRERKRKS